MKKLSLSGTPSQRGAAQGEHFRSEIRELANIRLELCRGYLKDLGPEKLEELALRLVAALRKYPSFYEEFVAIGQAANVTLVDLMILNNYTDMRDFSHNETLKHSKPFDDQDGGCSTFCVRDTQNKRTLFGQTWDMHASAAPFMVHLKFEDGVKADVLTLTGCLALSGVNEFGVGVFINNLHCRESSFRLMWTALVRGMLEQKSALEAKSYLEKNIPASAHNYLICDAKEAFNVETTGLRSEVTQHLTGDGVAFHTNHFVGKLVETEILERRSKTSVTRFENLKKYFSSHSTRELTLEKLVQDHMVEQSQCSESVFVKHPGAKDPHGSFTCGNIIVELSGSQRRLQLF